MHYPLLQSTKQRVQSKRITIMNITIKINTDNAVFEDDCQTELEHVLERALIKLKSTEKYAEHLLYDSNGNRCGLIIVEAS
jgi:hypothetical protein